MAVDLGRIFAPGRIITWLALACAAVGLGLFIGLGAHAHAEREHCNEDIVVLLEQVSTISWAVLSLLCIVTIAWFAVLMGARRYLGQDSEQGRGFRILGNSFLFAAQVLPPLLSGTILVKLQLATRSCGDVFDHMPLAGAAAAFGALFPIVGTILSRFSLDNFTSTELRANQRLRVFFNVMVGIAGLSQVVCVILFGLWGGDFASRLEDRALSDCPSPFGSYAFKGAAEQSRTAGWMGLSMSSLLLVVWAMMYATRDKKFGRFAWYRPMIASLLTAGTVLQSLAAGMLAGASFEPVDGVYDQMQCSGSFVKYEAAAVILIMVVVFHYVGLVLLVRVRTTFTISAQDICNPNIDDDTAYAAGGNDDEETGIEFADRSGPAQETGAAASRSTREVLYALTRVSGA